MSIFQSDSICLCLPVGRDLFLHLDLATNHYFNVRLGMRVLYLEPIRKVKYCKENLSRLLPLQVQDVDGLLFTNCGLLALSDCLVFTMLMPV